MKALSLLRIFGLLTATVLAVIVALSSGPVRAGVPKVDVAGTASSIDGDVAAALSKAERNESSADSAPKQQVVNGWAARDLLGAIGLELGSIHRNQVSIAKVQTEQLAQSDLTQVDDRVPLLLAIPVGVVAWWGALASVADLIDRRRSTSSLLPILPTLSAPTPPAVTAGQVAPPPFTSTPVQQPAVWNPGAPASEDTWK